jgi:hypothetical protein
MKKTILLFCLSLCVFILNAQIAGDYRSTAAVTLQSASNWQTYDGSVWNTATLPPNGNVVTGNTINIRSTHAWTNTTAATIPVGVTLLFQGTTTAATDFTSNTLVINGTYIHNSPHGSTAGVTSQMAHVFTAVNSATGLGASSTVVVRGSASFTSAQQPFAAFGGRTYNNLTYDVDAVAGTFANLTVTNSPGSPWTVNGTLTVSGWSNVSFSGSASLATMNGDIIISNSGKLTTGNVNQAGTTKTVTINSGCALSTAQPTVTITSFTFTVNGVLANSGTLTINGASGFSGTLLVNGTLTHNSGASLTVNSFATLNVTAAGTFENKSIAAITVSGTMTVNGIFKQNADANTIPKTNVTYATGSTIQVTGIVSSASVTQLPTSCYNVLWNSTGQQAIATNTFFSGTPTTINGDFTIQSTGAGTIYIGGGGTSRTLNVIGNLNVSGGNLKLITSNGATVNQVCNVTGNVNVSGGSFLLSDVTSPSTGIGQLNVGGNLNHTAGTFGNGASAVNNSGALTFTGNNTDKTISTTGVSNGLNMVIDKTAAGSISLATNMPLGAGSRLIITTGTFKLNGFTTTLKSTLATNSARVYVSSGAAIDQSVAGSKFTVEQYIPGGTRSYRFFGHPFNSSINLSELTDDIDITGNDGNAAVAGTGFSATGTNSASAFWYDPLTGNGSTSAGWIAYTRNDGVNATVDNTSNTWNVAQGIRALVRGPKGQSGVLTISPMPNAATINMSGKINDGTDVVVSLTKGTNSGFNLISNPYCAPLDVFQFRTANSNANASAGTNFYVWLPTGGVNGRGQYVTGDMTSSGETYRYLPAYSSFFVDIATTTTATFKESHKAASTQAVAYNLRLSSTSAYGENTIQLQLSRNNIFEDRVLLFFNNKDAKPSFDATDAVKLESSNLNFYTLSTDEKHLAIDRRPLNQSTETIIPLVMSTSLQSDYSIDAKDFDLTGAEMYLRDKFLNKEMLLSQGASYPFAVTADNASQGNARFELVLKPIIPIVIAPLATSFKVNLSPNPVSNQLTVTFTNKEKASTSISFINATGQSIKFIDAGTVQSGNIKVDVSKWAKGVYHVTFNNGTEKSVQQIQVL